MPSRYMSILVVLARWASALSEPVEYVVEGAELLSEPNGAYGLYCELEDYSCPKKASVSLFNAPSYVRVRDTFCDGIAFAYPIHDAQLRDIIESHELMCQHTFALIE